MRHVQHTRCPGVIWSLTFWRVTSAGAALALGLGVNFATRAAETVSEQIAVTGAVKIPLSLKVDDLEAFPADQIVSVSVMRRVGDTEVASSARGVKLSAVLDRAGLVSTDKNDWRHTAVLATATDGYQVVFSWPELFNTEIGGGVLIVFERDGQPLADREGRIALVSARDLRSGPRSVRWLARIDVRVLKE